MFSIGKASSDWAKQSRMNVLFQKTVDSTNNWAKEKAFSQDLSASPISLFLAEVQTHGRGRGENTWQQAESGTSFLSSWIFELSRPPRPVITCRIGLAVEKALSTTWPWLPFALKAPNDIYIGTKKLAGILVENLQQGKLNCMIVGLGLNVFTSPELPHATSLLEHLESEKYLTLPEWNVFLDRLFLELSLAISLSADTLSATEQQALLHALNKKVDLTEKYLSVEADGNLVTSERRIHWSEL